MIVKFEIDVGPRPNLPFKKDSELWANIGITPYDALAAEQTSYRDTRLVKLLEFGNYKKMIFTRTVRITKSLNIFNLSAPLRDHGKDRGTQIFNHDNIL
jgi:hypothetical protein